VTGFHTAEGGKHMRFLHTADWHLGRSFFNVSLIDDQAYVLNQLIDIGRDTKPDAVVIAGDVFDRAVPPAEAVKLLDEIVCRLILDLKVVVILIAGNHDSPLRLDFAARLMESHRLYLYGALSDRRLQAIDVLDDWGRVSFYPMPFAEPSEIGTYLQAEGIHTQAEALQRWTAWIKNKHRARDRAVLIHHGFVAGGEESDSERVLDVGGSGLVPAEYFDDFQYVALGHLHRPQSVGANGHLHYPGSLLKYSFSEAEQTKGVKLVTLDGTGVSQVDFIPLVPQHDVRCVSGTMNDLLQGPVGTGNRDDYVQVQLMDKGAVFDAMGRLREVFPNLVNMDHPGLTGRNDPVEFKDHRTREPLSLFDDFYAYATGEPPTPEQRTAFAEIVDQLRQEERLA
jgi:DNA repair protein SbcD/Mre11